MRLRESSIADHFLQTCVGQVVELFTNSGMLQSLDECVRFIRHRFQTNSAFGDCIQHVLPRLGFRMCACHIPTPGTFQAAVLYTWFLGAAYRARRLIHAAENFREDRIKGSPLQTTGSLSPFLRVPPR